MPEESEGHAQPVSQPAPRRRWLARLGRCLLCWLAILLLIATVSYCIEFYRCARYTPTGDTLFDRYARAVIRRQAPRLWFQRPRDYLTPQAHVPDSALARWEGEFGADPRYWELRCWNANYDESAAFRLKQVPAWRESGHPDGRARDFLIAGWQQGARDWVLMTLVAREAQGSMYDALELHKAEYGAPGSPEFTKKFGAARSELETEVQALYAEAITLAPDEAWPYYERALYWLALGEYELAEADFATGNSAKSVTYPCLFPESTVRASLDETNYRVNAAVNGAILIAGYLQAKGLYWIKVKDHAKELIVAEELGGPAALTTEFHRFLCRSASSDQSETVATAAVFSSMKMLYGYYLTAHPDLTRDERQILVDTLKEMQDTQLLFSVETFQVADSGGCVISYLPAVANDPRILPSELDFIQPINPNYGSYQRFNWRCSFRRSGNEDTAWGEMMKQLLCRERLYPIATRLEQLDFADIENYSERFGQP